MPDKPQEGRQNLEGWFIGSDQPSSEPVTSAPQTGLPPIEPEPPILPPESEPKQSNWARGVVLVAAMLAFTGAGAYHFYPNMFSSREPIPVEPQPEPKPQPPEPPAPPVTIPEPEPPKDVPAPVVKEEPKPLPAPRPEPGPGPKKVVAAPPIERVEPPAVKPEAVKPEPIQPPVRNPEPPVVLVPDPGPQPTLRTRLPRPVDNPVVTQAPPVQPPPVQPRAPRPMVYSGPPAGVINWSGRLEKNGSLAIDGATTQSGTVNGALPGVPVMIEIDTNEFAIAEAPSPSNGWKRLVIRSRRKTHSVVTIKWTVM